MFLSGDWMAHPPLSFQQLLLDRTSFQLLSKVTVLGGKVLALKSWVPPVGIDGWWRDLSLLSNTGEHLLL